MDTIYIVELKTDPTLEYVVSEIKTEHLRHIDVTKVFGNPAPHTFPQAIFHDHGRAKEYAAYRNLRYWQVK